MMFRSMRQGEEQVMERVTTRMFSCLGCNSVRWEVCMSWCNCWWTGATPPAWYRWNGGGGIDSVSECKSWCDIPNIPVAIKWLWSPHQSWLTPKTQAALLGVMVSSSADKSVDGTINWDRNLQNKINWDVKLQSQNKINWDRNLHSQSFSIPK